MKFDPNKTGGQPPDKPGTPGPGGEDPPPPPAEADKEGGSGSPSDKRRKTGDGGPPGDPDDPDGEDVQPQDDDEDDDAEENAVPEWRRNMTKATWAELDERPGTTLTLSTKLEGKSFGRSSTPHKVTVYEEYKK